MKHNESLRQALISSDRSKFIMAVDLDNVDLVLRDCLTIEEMREAGSFFTGTLLAEKAIESFECPLDFDSVVLDPTCGAGNLLIACSRRLNVEKKLSETLSKWGEVLHGYDISTTFIEATKLRLIIEALHRGTINDCDITTAMDLLPNISIKNSIDIEEIDLTNITHIIMNPPFTIWESPKTNYWKSGKINAAGIFLDKYVRNLPVNCNLSAILPDVLRSGSRYADLRNYISTKLEGETSIWGRFNAKTDVDVFILSGKLKDNITPIKWFPISESTNLLSSLYEVRTGPLVAYRDPQEGEEYPYIHPKNCTAWLTLTDVDERRRFSGTVLMPPFVVVKRTSSPSDRFRASATIINLKEDVAVENHLIIIKPKSLKLDDCKILVELLKSDNTNEFLNQRIRLRHLTIGVIKDIPLI
jgi:hypothetical protein